MCAVGGGDVLTIAETPRAAKMRATDRRSTSHGQASSGNASHLAVGPVRGERERPPAGQDVLGLERLEGARAADRFDGAGGERMPGAIGRGEIGLRRIAGDAGAGLRTDRATSAAGP